jgi:SDR family mycofactocin-dependent oxidoreductase
MGRVDGKVALISGAGHGQARSHALLLAQEGADIVIFDACEEINPNVGYPMATSADLDETARLVEKAGRRVVARKADVRDIEAVRRVVSDGIREFGHIDIVCASAGIISYHPLIDIPEQDWDDIVDVNLKGVWNTVRAALPPILESGNGGSVIITSSSSGIRPIFETAHYSAAKAGTVGLMKSVAVEYARYGIRCNTIHPCGVGPDDHWGNVADSYMGTRDTVIKQKFQDAQARGDQIYMLGATTMLPDPSSTKDNFVPARTVEPIDVSNVVLFLASDESRYITGAQINVDAGQLSKP